MPSSAGVCSLAGLRIPAKRWTSAFLQVHKSGRACTSMLLFPVCKRGWGYQHRSVSTNMYFFAVTIIEQFSSGYFNSPSVTLQHRSLKSAAQKRAVTMTSVNAFSCLRASMCQTKLVRKDVSSPLERMLKSLQSKKALLSVAKQIVNKPTQISSTTFSVKQLQP